MRDEGKTTSEVQDQPFSSSPDLQNHPSANGVDELLLIWMTNEAWEGVGEPDIVDGATWESKLELAPECLDLWKFGHVTC
jgi:hypothetical protein